MTNFHKKILLCRGAHCWSLPREKERSPLFLLLQTPSKSFRLCSLLRVLWGVLWEVKSTSWIFMSSYGKKLFLHICKLDQFKSKQIWVDENVGIYLFTRTLWGCKFWQRPCNTILCTGEIFLDRTLASSGYITYFIFWGGGRGFSDSVTSLA